MDGSLVPSLDKLSLSSYVDATERARGAISSRIRQWRSSTTTCSRRWHIPQLRCCLCRLGALLCTRQVPPLVVHATGGERTGGTWYLHSALLAPELLAATHQAGSVMLLSAVLHVLLALRRPGAAARVWWQANLAR
ncbi:hypothetical protein EDB87DRAFT_1661078, partial [Lactarius vividus]